MVKWARTASLTLTTKDGPRTDKDMSPEVQELRAVWMQQSNVSVGKPVEWETRNKSGGGNRMAMGLEVRRIKPTGQWNMHRNNIGQGRSNG